MRKLEYRKLMKHVQKLSQRREKKDSIFATIFLTWLLTTWYGVNPLLTTFLALLVAFILFAVYEDVSP